MFSPDSGFLQRTFGGHVAGQSLVSAVRTVDPRYQVHSLHGYFLRPGDAKERTIFIVERTRDGGSFATRRVNAIQHGEIIFSMGASFQTDQEGISHQDAMPAAPPPDGLPGLESVRVFDDAGFKQFEEWDVCIVPRAKLQLLPGKASQQQVWFRHRDPLPDDPVLHICALAYMSDLTLLGSAQVTHLDVRSTCRWRRWITRCGSCGPSAPTSGCSTTSPRRRPTVVARSPRARSSPSVVSWWRRSCRRG